MIDRQSLEQELEAARLARLDAQAAGVWLEDLIAQLREGGFWRHLTFAPYPEAGPQAVYAPVEELHSQPLAA